MSFRAALIALTWASTANAQLRADSAWRDLRRLGGDAWSVWTSPVQANARDLEGLAVVGVATGLAAAFDAPVQRWILSHKNSWPVNTLLHPLREDARYPAYELGSGQYLLPLSAVLYFAGSAGRSQSLRDAGLGCATAHLTSAGAREIVYLIVARDRPRLAPDDPFHITMPGSHDWNRHSFFSGHIANSMGCASFFAHRFSLHAAEPLIYLFVTAIGAGRVVDGRHWLSDTVVGGLFGYVVGRTISARMLAREKDSKTAPAAPVTVSISLPFD